MSTEVDRAHVVLMLVGDERRVLIEMLLRVQIKDRVDGCLVQRHITFAQCALELVSLNLYPLVSSTLSRRDTSFTIANSTVLLQDRIKEIEHVCIKSICIIYLL